MLYTQPSVYVTSFSSILCGRNSGLSLNSIVNKTPSLQNLSTQMESTIRHAWVMYNTQPAFWCKLQKTCFLKNFAANFLLFFSFLPLKMLKMTISTSVWQGQHPKAGQNIQHLGPAHKFTFIYVGGFSFTWDNSYTPVSFYNLLFQTFPCFFID